MPEKVKVVLVDNDPDELYFMDKGFSGCGYFEVLTCVANADELYAFLDNNAQDTEVVVTDLNLGAKSGIQIAQELNASPRFGRIRVIVLSITSGEDHGPELTGSSLFFPKPKSLLEYTSFASAVYERLNTDAVNGWAS